jgi:hypothetical protein
MNVLIKIGPAGFVNADSVIGIDWMPRGTYPSSKDDCPRVTLAGNVEYSARDYSINEQGPFPHTPDIDDQRAICVNRLARAVADATGGEVRP